jgi:hypothetical protein
MIRTGAQCREGLRDGREVWIDGERVKDIRVHPAVIPMVDIRARICDMQHEPVHSSVTNIMHDHLNPDYAGHRLTFVQFAQAPHCNHLAAVYGAFDFSGPLGFVRTAAGLSDKVKRSP